MAKKPLKLAVIDTETDPFKPGRVPQPFACEFLSDDLQFNTWGDNCIADMVTELDKLSEPHLIFAHNGGKFDFHFFFPYIDNPLSIINGRIVKAKLGIHTVQDSLAIIPVPLAAYNKDKIDYAIMERERRERHRRKIEDYLHSDCVYLLQLVSAFVERFGKKLTVGSTAIKELQKLHPTERMQSNDDPHFRKYYFGGRVECFNSGILRGPWQYYDVNSMYPKAMRDYNHPLNNQWYSGEPDCMPPDGSVYFMHWRGKNHHAVPVKTTEGLDFTAREGEFFTCSHEIEAALELGLIEIDEILSTTIAYETVRFDGFVDKFYNEKVEAKKAGDKISEMFAKFMLNSAYGKFGTNPANFEDWYINRDFEQHELLRQEGFECRQEYDAFELWSRPTVVRERHFFDVSIAASITSAARSILMRGLSQAMEPVYCDTDSIICRGFTGEVSSTILGAWKHETTADHVAIAGKKLYAMWNDGNQTPVKLASKGGNLNLATIRELANDGTFDYSNAAPTFSMINKPRFITRKFAKTA